MSVRMSRFGAVVFAASLAVAMPLGMAQAGGGHNSGGWGGGHHHHGGHGGSAWPWLGGALVGGALLGGALTYPHYWGGAYNAYAPPYAVPYTVPYGGYGSSQPYVGYDPATNQRYCANPYGQSYWC